MFRSTFMQIFRHWRSRGEKCTNYWPYS